MHLHGGNSYVRVSANLTATLKEQNMTRTEYQKLLKFYMFTTTLSNEVASAMIRHLMTAYKGVNNG